MKRFLVGLALALSVFSCRSATLVERVSSSIVRVTGITEVETMFGSEEGLTVCTGFPVKRPDLILTAAHCAGQDMLIDGRSATLLGKDEYTDLALYSVPGLTRKPLVLSPVPAWEGEPLTAIGYGFGWTQPTVTHNIVSNPAYHPTPKFSIGVISQGEPVAGMSGGPNVDSQGRVVCVVQQGHSGMAYGVSVPVIKAFLYQNGVE